MRTTLLFSTAMALLLASVVTPAVAEPAVARYLGAEPKSFADPDAALAALKAALEAGDVDELAAIIGLDAQATKESEGFDERLAELGEAARERAQLTGDDADSKNIILGDLIWPFPFPLVKTGTEWRFDTEAGLEEIIDRRIGENELETIKTVRNYIAAQNEYESQDRDDDGVLEFAQVLRSPEGTKDGLFWPADEFGESPAGPFVDEAKAEKAGDAPGGYFGYRYRILKSQGENIAGGAYDYVINGNMIAGFALVAVPAIYDETGIKTFVVSHHGVVYEKDLGPDTESLAAGITTFNPDQTWEVVGD